MVDIDIIMDEFNVAAPRRGIRVQLQSFSEKLVDKVELAQMADPATSKPVETFPAESSHAASRATRSSRSTPLSAHLYLSCGSIS